MVSSVAMVTSVTMVTEYCIQVSFSYKIDTTDNSNPYNTMRDHVIDGRNLLPATGYLYLVWRSVATGLHSTVEKCPVSLQHVTLHQVR